MSREIHVGPIHMKLDLGKNPARRAARRAATNPAVAPVIAPANPDTTPAVAPALPNVNAAPAMAPAIAPANPDTTPAGHKNRHRGRNRLNDALTGALAAAVLIGGGVLIDSQLRTNPNVIAQATPTTDSAAGTPNPQESALAAQLAAIQAELAANKPAAPASQETPANGEFSLTDGTVFHSGGWKEGDGIDRYQVVVVKNTDGTYRLWQPLLPKASERKAFTVAIKLPRGWEYEFNSVEGRLNLDTANNGKGASNPVVANHENGKIFDVPAGNGTEADKNAWALDTDSGGWSGGIEIKALHVIS